MTAHPDRGGHGSPGHRLRSGRRATDLVVSTAALVLGAVLATVLLLKWAPEWLASGEVQTPVQRAEDVGRVRTALLATVAGLIAVVGAVYTARTFSLNREGQITERFGRAVDQLGHAARDVRIGGLYALARLARESRTDYVPIMEILAAYVRHRARVGDPERDDDQADAGAGTGSAGGLTTDVQVALAILTRSPDGDQPPVRIDLSSTDLSGARMQNAYLAGADLRGARFGDADLAYADMRGAALEAADLGTARHVPLAELEAASYDSDTAWPAGFDATAAGAIQSGVPKRLVLCCDGTWTDRDIVGPGRPAPTNVEKFFRAVAKVDRDGNPQLRHYVAGVRRLGGLRAVSHDILDGYRFLVDTYEPGDPIYLCGFSRGAYVARSIVGLITVAGIVRREHADRVPEAYELYRSRRVRPIGEAARAFRRRHATPDEVTVAFLGVWDTVGPLGIPRSRWTLRKLQFHNVTLSEHVRAAHQALALDEHRRDFAPTLWQRRPDAPAGQLLEQVWFAGSHGDVGGGYTDTALADITLLWMVDAAQRAGLLTEDGALASASPDPLGRIHPVGVNRFSPPFHRRVTGVDGGSVSSSVLTRMNELPAYRPRNMGPYLGGADGGPG